MAIKLKRTANNAVSMLKADHEKVKELFDKFEKATTVAAKKKIAAEALGELKIHATIEEEYFYPAMRQQIEDKEGIMEEADEEHHVAKVLIAELDAMNGSEDHWEAKFMVLAENIRHHIKEEESDMFKKAKATDIDFEALGSSMAQLKRTLKKDGVPPDAEARMVKNSGLRGDSPARKAQKTIVVPLNA